MSCPTCGTTLPVYHGYVTWCHECGWNLAAPPRPDVPPRRLDRLYEAAGRRLGDRLVSELRSADQLEPRPTPSRIAAYAIAVAVYALTTALGLGGAALAVLAFPNIAALVAAVLMVGTAVLMRPRLGRVPDEGLLTRSEAPVLYGLLDEVADALATPRVDVVEIDREFNASWAILGLRRRRVLTLGLPLLAALAPQERVALIAHELAHARNGDATRGLLVGSAQRGLAELYGIVGPEDDAEHLDLGHLVVNWVLYVVSRPVYLLLLLDVHLLLRDMQRAEYLADALAARVAGSEAAIALEEKTLLQSTFRSVVQRAARAGAEPDLFAELNAAISAVPERERERRRRVARLEETRLSDTHPPTAKRIALLEARRAPQPFVTLDAHRAASIDAELASRRTPLQKLLIDDYRDSLYV